MANLFWKTHGETSALLSIPYKTEEEFERTVFDTAELLSDIYLLKRQVRGGHKAGIPDIIGVDSDGNICIIEMKNTTVDASIIPQVLQYAFWAETNPDSIKSLWLEADDRPEDIEVTWDECQVRILVIAPTILRSTLALIDKINYPVDLIEITRWVEKESEFLLVNKLEEEKEKKRTKTVKGLQAYDKEFYRSRHNKQSVEKFFKFIDELEQIVKKQGWQLEKKFNKGYCGFKAGFYNVFGVQWIGSKSFAFFFKVLESEAKSTGIKITKYQSQWKQAVYYIDPDKTKVKDFIPLFEVAYKKRAGD